MSCEESTDSEEEILVFAEFEESVNIKNYRSIHVLGITEKHPIIQMDETIFTGQLESSLGTYMFFTKDPTPQSADPLFDKLPKENFKYVCKGNKYLNMKHTYITPKDGTEQAVSRQLQQADIELVPASFKTVHEAIEAFKKEWEPITQETNIKTTNSLPCDKDIIMTDLSRS